MKPITPSHSFPIRSIWPALSLALLTAAAFIWSAAAGTLIWNGGGGANGNWNIAANWFGIGTPTNGDTVVFQGAAGLNTTNNIVGLTLNQIQFRNGGFTLNGNAFTITNSILATNTSGANTMNNNFTLATADVTITVSNTTTLICNGNIGGAVGVVKTGTGTLLYQAASGNNTYTGTTLVLNGLLQLNVAGSSAFGGPLVIGLGSGLGNPVVRNLQSTEIPDYVPITINGNGTLDLNNYSETIGTSLTMTNGIISTGSGLLTLSPNATVTVASNPAISGNLNVGTSGTCTFQGAGNYIVLNCVLSGAANIVKNGGVSLWIYGANTFSGTITANNSGYLYAVNNNALGATNSGTILNGSTLIYLNPSINITNESLAINTSNNPAIYIYSNTTNVWACTNITLASDASLLINASSVLELNAPIGGSGGLTKDGSGQLLYSGAGANTYTGTTTVINGELGLNKNSVGGALGNGATLMVDGSTVRWYSDRQIWSLSNPLTITNSAKLDLNGHYDGMAPLALNGGNVYSGVGGFLALSGTVTIGDGTSIYGTVRLDSNPVILSNTLPSNLNLVANIYGFGAGFGLTKTGNGSVYLFGTNTFSGPTMVQQGYLYLKNSFALGATNSGTFVDGGAFLGLMDNVAVTNEPLTLNGSGFSTQGTLYATGTNVWFGPITNNGGCFISTFDTNSQLHLNGPISGTGILAANYSGSGTVTFEGGATNSYAGQTVVYNGTLDLNKSIINHSIPGDLVISSFGTVELLSSQQIADSANVQIYAGGLFDTGIYWEDMDTLTGGGQVHLGVNGYIECGRNNGSSTFDGVITGVGFASGFSVAQSGSGTFTMNGDNTFTAGAYKVFSPGKMIYKGSSPQVPVIVNNGATFGGSGTVGTIWALGGILPGNSPGILSSSNVTFTASGSLNLDIFGPTAGTDYDQLRVTGTNALSSAALNINLFPTNHPLVVGQTLTLINNDLADAFTGTFTGKPEGTVISQNGYKGTLSYVGGSGNDLTLTITAIPATALDATIVSGNGSHTIDPNECNSLYLVITNSGGATMNNIQATLSTATPHVIISQPYSAYPNLVGGAKASNVDAFQISTLSDFICGTDINLQLIVKSSLGSFIAPFVLRTGAVASSPWSYLNSTATAIPDVGAVDSTNRVSAFFGPLEKVTVSAYITHTFDSDLSLQLVSPDGTTVLLVTNSPGGADFGDISNWTTFDDAAGIPITAGTAPFIGTFRPMGALTNFNFSTALGDWKLHIVDKLGGSLGTLRSWMLSLYSAACNDGGGNCDYCLTSITGSITNTDPLMAGRASRTGVEASCGTPKVFPGIFEGSPFHYDLYAFTNTSAADACVTVVLNALDDVQAVVYLNNFDPANITNNYAADSGNSTYGYYGPIGPQICSAEIPAGAKFFVVVNEISLGAGSVNYTLQVSGLPCPPPALAINPVSTNNLMRLHWPTWAGGYLLQSNLSLLTTNWFNVTNEPIVSLGRFNLTNRMSQTNLFYRLMKP